MRETAAIEAAAIEYDQTPLPKLAIESDPGHFAKTRFCISCSFRVWGGHVASMGHWRTSASSVAADWLQDYQLGCALGAKWVDFAAQKSIDHEFTRVKILLASFTRLCKNLTLATVTSLAAIPNGPQVAGFTAKSQLEPFIRAEPIIPLSCNKRVRSLCT